mmetsp:Transcript_7025/g.9744  ORF Transcript_7025/g.9744 Transcript_7025/m.9744 type:complete len:450 (+) Transcript_7025:297-1646(+)|eukprot:CAMPEP_0184478962 /NCGR_PEP_ID=MMETSP0113_2-20130426/840_1 /TAXON_ID=91329 /ORGANISM="Norrisiella sphaerica, Strain BC52" /LENGTH=449 /DNA_ID=CAMNT_0026856919 /DNA_START=340 /DNA_END=1689 /DNA_ORIENTATION=+
MWEAMFGDQNADAKTLYAKISSVWLLGIEYSIHSDLRKHRQAARKMSPKELRDSIMKDIQKRNKRIYEDFYSRPWFTYREDFPAIGPLSLTSDAGWGCMLRTSQMMFCQGFLTHNLGRDWRFDPRNEMSETYGEILRWFLDSPEQRCPYSLHNLLKHAKCVDKKVGEWFGPQAACIVFKRCHEAHMNPKSASKLPIMYISSDGTMYLDQVLSTCAERKGGDGDLGNIIGRDEVGRKSGYKSGDGNLSEAERMILAQSCWKPMIIVIPVRLGLDSVNPGYINGLLRCLKLPQSLGFVGGRPRSSLYFLGFQEDRLIYLDPHTIQKTRPRDERLTKNSSTFHCGRLRTLKITEIDPSLALGFYCRDKGEFMHLWSCIEEMQTDTYPPFRVATKTPKYEDFDVDMLQEEVEKDPKEKKIDKLNKGTDNKREGERQKDRAKHSDSQDDGFILI